MLLEPGDDGGAAVDEGLDQLGPTSAGAEAQAVGQGLRPAVLGADIGHVMVLRDPDPPAGHRGGPAHILGPLQDRDPRAGVVGADGGHQGGAP